MEEEKGRKYDRRKSNSNQQLMDIGKMPPQAVDLEEAVLGSIMLEKECISIIATILDMKSFYKDAHARIYNAILTLFNSSAPVDILTVTKELQRTGELDLIGGAYYITQLTNRVASAANAEYHARLIQQKFIQRELIRISTQAINAAYEDSADIFDLLETAEKELYKISAGNFKQDLQCTSELVGKAIKEIEAAGKATDGVSGVPSGIHSIDRLTGGWQNSELIIIAARPAMGKTAFCLTVAANAAFQFEKKVAVFSLEMSKMQLMKRLLSSEAEINSHLLRTGKLEPHEWTYLQMKLDRLYKKNLFIDDTPGISILELRSKARRMKEKNGLDLLVVDYLQLMVAQKGGNKGNREQEISEISRSLKGLSKDLDIPVIALSQLSRAVEMRGGDKRPMLSDLRESGAIEQDADQVIFLHRPEYYNILEDSQGNSTAGFAEAIIAKNRNGATDSADMRYVSPFTKFVEWNSGGYNPILPNPNQTSESNKDDLPF